MTRLRPNRLGERGSIAPAVPVIAAALLLLGGLGIDGSRQLNARGQAVAFAEEAARAGAQGVDIDRDDLTLDPGLVQSRVAEYCARVLALQHVTECRFAGISNDDNGRPLVVEASVATSINTSLLGMIGVHTLTASSSAQAQPFEGVVTPDDF